MENNIDFYKQYHTHPVNKIIHFFCIPIIAFCFLNFFSSINLIIKYHNYFNILHAPFDILITLFYCIYYTFFWPSHISSIMIPFYLILCGAAHDFRNNNNWLKLNTILFITAWILQFLGHYIEGNRPALMDSLSQAFLTAPAFAVLEPFGLI